VSRTQELVERARAEGAPVVWVLDHSEFEPGTPDWQLPAPLQAMPGEAVIRKRYRDAFCETDLGSTLTRLGTGHLAVGGSQSDYCVRTTAQRAAQEGYDVTLVADCHTTSQQEYGGMAISGEQAVAHTNLYWQGYRWPGGTFAVADHDAVLLSPAGAAR
jgi:nicotinamidase-related amidase